MKEEIERFSARLAAQGYIADRELATTLLLLQRLDRPLLLEGEAGVGKTAVARALAAVEGRPLIRLQCYEGLEATHALYEWNYPHQLLAIRLMEQSSAPPEERELEIFSERFLLPRPLLQAITSERPAVLLIDEVDRADEEFEAFLLELLSDFQVTIPELGTRRAVTVPRVVLTSNATRELSDALRRRCLYHYLDFPDPDKELCILRTHLPEIDQALAGQVVRFVQALRGSDLRKRPGVAETLDWARALMGLGVTRLSREAALVQQTLACLLKTAEDFRAMDAATCERLLEQAAG